MRGNPVEQPAKRVTLSQKVETPIGNDTNTDKGNPAKLRVPQNKAKTLDQKVVNPSVGAARGKADVVTPGKKSR